MRSDCGDSGVGVSDLSVMERMAVAIWDKTLLAGALVVPVLLACRQTPERVTEPVGSEKERLVRLGSEVSEALMKELKTALGQAMSQGGARAAIEVCSERAVELTEGISAAYPGLEVKRTSLKYRNPRNAPDDLEKAALAFFETEQKRQQALSPFFLQKIADENGVSYRYYQPLKVGGMCLGCHGKADRLNPDAVTILQKIYPEDRASGYEEGDFRGVISVTVTDL